MTLNEVLTPYELDLYKEWVEKADYAKVGVKTTACLLTLSNGFEILGTSACVNPADFDAEIGKQYALKEALNELDRLAGFYRQVKLAEEANHD
jgi:hypothetical protein